MVMKTGSIQGAEVDDPSAVWTAISESDPGKRLGSHSATVPRKGSRIAWPMIRAMGIPSTGILASKIVPRKRVNER